MLVPASAPHPLESLPCTAFYEDPIHSASLFCSLQVIPRHFLFLGYMPSWFPCFLPPEGCDFIGFLKSFALPRHPTSCHGCILQVSSSSLSIKTWYVRQREGSVALGLPPYQSRHFAISRHRLKASAVQVVDFLVNFATFFAGKYYFGGLVLYWRPSFFHCEGFSF